MNVTEAYMKESRVGAHETLAKIVAIGDGIALAEDQVESADPVHPHKTKEVAAQNAAAFRGLIGN